MNPSQYLIMHALIYRTEVLRQSGLRLPKHTFYVDNIVAYHRGPMSGRCATWPWTCTTTSSAGRTSR